jgi:glycosyltransferase involved in cell wall biosynthesis
MALQAQQLVKLLRMDGNFVVFFPSNVAFPEGLAWLDHLPGLRTFVRSALIWIGLWKKVRQVEIVHVLAASWVYFFTVVYPATIVGRILGKRLILNYRGGEATRFFARWGWLATPVFKMADVITAPSDFLAGVIQAQFRVPIVIVPNILNLSTFNYRQRMSFGPTMLVSRHLEKIYDIESVVKAFRAVQEDYPEASLLIAGTGSQEERLRNLVSIWRLKNVTFLGRIDHEQLAPIYDQCDILLNASTVDNFPAALLEASAAGLVVVSTSPGGIPFIYQDGKSALLVKPGDWQGLAAAVGKVLRNPSLATRLTTEAAALARTCDWVDVRRSLYGAYGVPLAEPKGKVIGSAEMVP